MIFKEQKNAVTENGQICVYLYMCECLEFYVYTI